jgi:hypothetical protein
MTKQQWGAWAPWTVIVCASLTLCVAFGVAAAPQPPPERPARFDNLVRDDFYAGFQGDAEALQRGMSSCEKALARDPKNADALVWHGSGLIFRSGEPSQRGDYAAAAGLWDKGMAEMDAAVALEPRSVTVLLARAATLESAAPYGAWRPGQVETMWQKAGSDYAATLKLQAGYWDKLSTHARGELLNGLALSWVHRGDPAQADRVFRRVVDELPKTRYSAAAREWLARPAPAPDRNFICVGCH